MRTLTLLLLLWTQIGFQAAAEDRFAKVEITSTKVTDKIYMLEGFGGNIGALVGDDGILLVDNQFRPLAEKIRAELSKVSDKRVKYIVNTHYHGDHTGGNGWFREMEDSLVLAHENVRSRMTLKEDHDPASLPLMTYEDGVRFHLNGETVHVIHLATSHTDSDSIVYFEQSNVIHAGDILFNHRFPYIDKKAGGTIKGALKSIQRMIEMSDEKTKIIAGHGELADVTQLQANYDMIKETADYVASKKAAGKSLEEVIAEGLDPKWAAWGKNWITEERWITTLY